MMLREPCRRPAAPRPAIALPTMNMEELTAAAESIEPTETGITEMPQSLHVTGELTLEYNYAGAICTFNAEEFVQVPECWLKSGNCEEVCRAIPGYIL